MDLNKDYYSLLGVPKDADVRTIKKSYYKLSFIYHPDRNKTVDPHIFADLTEAYDVLVSDQRLDYDIRSRFGACYDEYFELFDVDMNFDYHKEKSNLENFKKNEVLDIYIKVDDDFDGVIEYERWVKCKSCDGTGRDLDAKIIIRDKDGNILKTFDPDDGCDYCEGTGKDYAGYDCAFCGGVGKIGMTPCKKCGGEKRVLGKQKLSGIKLTGSETKIDAMGNCSKDVPGKVGYLLLIKKMTE